MQMTRTEVSRDFCVSESLLSSYEASGLIQCPHDTDGKPIYQEQEVQLVGLMKSLDFLFLRSFKVYLSAFFSIRCFGLIFTWSAFPSAKGKRGEAYINIAVFD